MRTTTLLTVASLFLVGSFSLPQPESVEASRTIEDREAKVAQGGPFPSFSEGAGWRNHHHDGGDSPTSNGTKIKERQEHHGRPSGPPDFVEHHHDGSGTTNTSETKIKERQEHHGRPEGPPEFAEHHHDGSGATNTSETKIKERQDHHGRPGGPPEFLEHHHDGSSATSTNETKIKKRQGPPGGGPPEGMTWKEFMRHRMHRGGSPSQSASVPLSTGTSSTLDDDSTDQSTTSTESNSTEVRMMKFRE